MALLLAVLMNLAARPVAAADFSVSAFGTLGYARSDQPYAYERFINKLAPLRARRYAGRCPVYQPVRSHGAGKSGPSATNDEHSYAPARSHGRSCPIARPTIG